MGVLWRKAPFVLRRHPAVLATIVLTVVLASLAVAAVPLMRAGIESESLHGQLRSLSPLGAGFEIDVLGNPVAGDRERRTTAARLARSLPFLGPSVASSLVPVQVAGSAAPGLEVVALARTAAVEHVQRLTPAGRPGVWIADSTAKVTRLRPGGRLHLTVHVLPGGLPRTVALPIAGIYHTLEADRDNPYWANWQQDIRRRNPDSPPPPAFVLMDERSLQRVARTLFPTVDNRFEFPVDPRHISFADARALDSRFHALGESLLGPGSPAGGALGCGPRTCRTSSSLAAALAIAAGEVAPVAPTIALLSGIGLAVALGLSVAAGLFLARRRADEVHVLFVRGEASAVFAARTALEAAVPALLGLAAGLAAALVALWAAAPDGTVTRETFLAGAGRAAAAAVLAVACVAAGAAVAFPRRTAAADGRPHLVRRVPWEVAPLAAGALLLALVLAGSGLAGAPGEASRPRLVVFAVPIVAVAGIAGLAVRLVRRLVARGGASLSPPLFLALRRVGLARGLFAAVIVAAAAAFGTFAYCAILSASLERSTAEKAFVSNGSDVQGLVDPAVRVTTPPAFPVALAEIDASNVVSASGERIDLVAADPSALLRTLRFDSGGDGTRRLLRRLAGANGRGLVAIASPGAPATNAVVDQGARMPVRVVGHAPIPGSTAGRPALLVPRDSLRRVARRAHILEPAPGAAGILWARGDPRTLMPLLESSNLAPEYLTTLRHVFDNASVAAAERSYRYVKMIGAAAAALALVALLLYLQARQRSQRLASALCRRMGLGAAGDAAALALEGGAIVLLAAAVGGAVAAATAIPIAQHVDSLPQYAPAPVAAVPWATLGLALAAAVVAGALLGVAAALVAARSDVAEALRVA